MSHPVDFSLSGFDGWSIAGRRWDTARAPRAVIQIAHGMGEHIGRYAEAACALAERGFAVVGADHRGHGMAITPSSPMGDFGSGGFGSVVSDMRDVTRYCRAEFPDVPIILLGHSMGSFAAQLYVLEDASLLAGLILSGSGALDQLAAALVTAKSPLDETLNATFAPVRTPFDWLSRDTATIDAFIADPLCFPELTEASARSVMENGETLADPQRLSAIPPDLPIFLISGSLDPIGQQGVGVERLATRYREAGLKAVDVKLYANARHEIFNEINRREVFDDVIDWLGHLPEST